MSDDGQEQFSKISHKGVAVLRPDDDEEHSIQFIFLKYIYAVVFVTCVEVFLIYLGSLFFSLHTLCKSSNVWLWITCQIR